MLHTQTPGGEGASLLRRCTLKVVGVECLEATLKWFMHPRWPDANPRRTQVKGTLVSPGTAVRPDLKQGL